MDAPNDKLLARLVEELGLLTPAQVAAALRLHADERPAPSLAFVLAECKLLPHERIAGIFAEHAAEFAAVDPRHAERVRIWEAAAGALGRGAASPEAVNADLRDLDRREQSGGAWPPITGLFGATRAADVPTILDAGSHASGPAGAAATVIERRAGGDAGRTAAEAPGTATERPRPALGKRFGKYELRSVLGRGGMGVVYRAFHPGLDAECAVKVLLGGDDASGDAVARFRQEAQTAARLRHPGIVAVHDIGEVDGVCYLAMELIDGQTLDHALAAFPQGYPAAEALRIVAEVAEAIQFAHEQGVIHRDIKPANVIRDAAGRLKVMDFGLAKSVDAGRSGATRSGTLVGTPAYMSPEQAAGRIEQVDASSDVYQLGALLYELLTARRPYDGESAMEVVLKVTREDPPRPRALRSDLERDAETICLRAMARDKRRRYPNARALADDCRRFVQGEAIAARRERMWERAARWAGRRKAVASLGAFCLAAIVFAGTVAGYNRALDRQVLADLRALASTNLEATLMVRRGGGKLSLAAEQFLAPLQEAVRKAEERAPGLAEPHYHLGRMYRALLRPADALAEQDRALACEPEFRPSLYERAVLRSWTFADRIEALREGWSQRPGSGARASGERPTPPTDEELLAADPAIRALHDDIARDLSRLGTPSEAGDPNALSEARLVCARGLFDFYVGGKGKAEVQESLRRALQLDPLLEEAIVGLAEGESQAGEYGQAVEILRKGIETDRGYVPFRMWRGGAYLRWGQSQEAHAEDPRPSYRLALEDFEAVLALAPEDADGRFRRGTAFAALAAYTGARGEDAAELFRRALADFDVCLKGKAGMQRHWLMRAAVKMQWALCRRARGEESGELCDSAIRDADEAVAREGGGRQARTTRAMLQLCRGRDLTGEPERAEAHFAAALSDFDKLIEEDPRSIEARLARAEALQQCGDDEWTMGRDPGTRYAAALADFAVARESDPRLARVRLGEGRVRSSWADWRADHGQDATELYGAALADLLAASELDPGEAGAWVAIAKVRLIVGSAGKPAGTDLSGLYEEVLEDYAKALRARPWSGEARIGLAATRGTYATMLASVGKDPVPVLEAAIREYEAVLEGWPGEAYGWAARADLRKQLAGILAARGADPRPLYAEATTDLDRALALAPCDGILWKRRGYLRILAGEAQSARGEDPRSVLTAAAADLDRAVQFSPELCETWGTRGAARFDMALALSARGEDPTETYAAADADFQKSLALTPGWVPAVDQRTRMLFCWGACLHYSGRDPLPRYRDALAELERGLQVHPERVDWRIRMGSVRLQQGIHELGRGLDPRDALGQSQANFAAALERDPASVEARIGRGDARANVGFWLSLRGSDPTEDYAAALADYAKAAETTPASAEAWSRQGTITAYAAHARQERGEDPGPGYEQALALCAKAIALSPTLVDPWAVRGGLRSEWGGWRLARGEDPDALWTDALADFDRAIELLPGYADTWVWRARLRLNRGIRLRDRGADPESEWQRAAQDLDRALALNPGLAGAWMQRGRLRRLQGARRKSAELLAAARTDLDRAAELDPAAAEVFWHRAKVRRDLGDAAGADADLATARALHAHADEVFAKMPE